MPVYAKGKDWEYAFADANTIIRKGPLVEIRKSSGGEPTVEPAAMLALTDHSLASIIRPETDLQAGRGIPRYAMTYWGFYVRLGGKAFGFRLRTQLKDITYRHDSHAGEYV